MERTFVIIKPNGVSSGLIGQIIQRYESARLAVSAIKIKQITQAEVEGFYAEHKEKSFFKELAQYMTEGPAVLIAFSGENAVSAVRTINGATNPEKADPGTIRYDYAPSMTKNVVHSSDSPASAEREISFWFKADELVSYPPAVRKASN